MNAMRIVVGLLLAVAAGSCVSQRPRVPTRAIAPLPNCAPSAEADARRRWLDAGTETGMSELRREDLEDVDGDGQPDLLLANGNLCGATGNCEYSVYASGGGCWRFVGEVDGVIVN